MSEDTVLAGFKDGVCWMASVHDSAEDCEPSFLARVRERGLALRTVTWKEAIAAANPGFRKSLRMLRKAKERQAQVRRAGFH